MIPKEPTLAFNKTKFKYNFSSTDLEDLGDLLDQVGQVDQVDQGVREDRATKAVVDSLICFSFQIKVRITSVEYLNAAI